MTKSTARQQYRCEMTKDVLYEEKTPLAVRNVLAVLEEEETQPADERQKDIDSMPA